MLISGLVAAADACDGRLSELYASWSISESRALVPYPVAPGLVGRRRRRTRVDPARAVGGCAGLTLTLAPVQVVGALAVTGLNVAGHRLDERTDAAGRVVQFDHAGPQRVLTRVGARGR